MNKKTKARSERGICPRSHRQHLLGQGLERRPPDSQSNTHCLGKTGGTKGEGQEISLSKKKMLANSSPHEQSPFSALR